MAAENDPMALPRPPDRAQVAVSLLAAFLTDVSTRSIGKDVARTTVRRTVPAAFSATETFDVGEDLGSPVSLDYFDRSPFQFDGNITKVDVHLK